MEFCYNSCGYRFRCIPFGSVDIIEMIVTQTIIDTENGKRYLLFKPINNSQKLYIREYFGKIEDEQYAHIRDDKTRKKIASFLKQCGMEFLESSL